jgi:hypothetical protein
MRDNKVVLSDDELSRLQSYRDDKFGTDSVPYGEVVDEMLQEVGYE